MSIRELFHLRPESGSVADARQLAHEFLTSWDLDGALGATVVLLVSELVTNAVLYGGPPIDLTLDWDDPVLRVEVSDGETRMPEMVEPPRAPGDGGYGLRIVEQLSHEWGIAPNDDAGKFVWFSMHQTARPS